MQRTLKWKNPWFWIVAVGAAACSSSSNPAPAPGPTQQTMVGPSGGTVASEGVTVKVPPGAVDSTVSVGVTRVAAAPENAVGPVFQLGPDNVTFKMPVTLTLPFSPGELPTGLDARSVRVFTAPAGSDKFTAMAAKVVDETHVEVETTHFSTWYVGTAQADLLVSGLEFPSTIALDGSSVYWLDTGGGAPPANGRVMKAPLGGGAPVVLASGQVDPKRIAIDATSVYWTTGGHPDSNVKGTVMSVPLAGGTPVPLAENLSFPRAIAVGGGAVHWSDYDEGRIYRVPTGGGTPTMVADAQSRVEAIAIDATDVYWTTSGGGTVMKAPLAGGTPTQLASGQGHPAGLALSDDTVYWVNQGQNSDAKGQPVSDGTGSVAKVAKAGGDPVVLASQVWKPYAIALDGTTLYWVVSGNGTLMSQPIAGGDAVAIVGDQAFPYGIALGGSSIYWVNNGNGVGGGSIARLAK